MLSLCVALAVVLAQAVEHTQPPAPSKAAAEQQQAQANNAAAAAAGAGAAIVATQQDGVLPNEDPFAFPAPTPRARQWLGYASPWTLLLLAAALTSLAALIGKYDPRKRKRIKRAT